MTLSHTVARELASVLIAGLRATPAADRALLSQEMATFVGFGTLAGTPQGHALARFWEAAQAILTIESENLARPIEEGDEAWHAIREHERRAAIALADAEIDQPADLLAGASVPAPQP